MKGTKDNIQEFSAAWLRADITPEQKRKAKQLARERRMTFQGWLGLLIESELQKSQQTGEAK